MRRDAERVVVWRLVIFGHADGSVEVVQRPDPFVAALGVSSHGLTVLELIDRLGLSDRLIDASTTSGSVFVQAPCSEDQA
ncbi:MAG: hypothetical protein HY704_11750 [Gemmatimonadetes bacterium]|nr:hypothetical protein [Gemmatimonadota bacterium]